MSCRSSPRARLLRSAGVATLWLLLGVLAPAAAADLGHPGAPEPANVGEIAAILHQDPYDIELLISFGTSKGGSAGHLAIGIREPGAADDMVYSANFYADRAPEHAHGFYTDDLMIRVPKREYLFGTSSSLGDTASFGLDFGEIYKRSVVGVRVYGIPESQKSGLAEFFARLNADYRRRARDADYHDGEVKYGYVRLNCAKTIGSAFKYGAGYSALRVKAPRVLRNRRVTNAANANIPTDMAVQLMKEFDARGYRMDVVLYRKYAASTYVDPHDGDQVAFKDLPNRFPSVLSLDFRNEDGYYQDYDNLFAMYLLYNLGRYGVSLDPATRLLAIDASKEPLSYDRAAALAADDARADSKNFLRRVLFKPRGKRVGEQVNVSQ